MTQVIKNRLKNTKRALTLFERAREMALEVYISMKPSHLKLMMKVQLMISRVYQLQGRHKDSLKLLWHNVSLYQMSCAVRMNEYMYCQQTDHPKMIKLSKYFICTLFQMIAAYTMLDELPASHEAAKLIEWTADTYFDKKSIFHINIMDTIVPLFDGLNYYLSMKSEMVMIVNRIVRKHFNPGQYMMFMDLDEQKEKPVGGFIPESSDEGEDTRVEKEKELEKELSGGKGYEYLMNSRRSLKRRLSSRIDAKVNLKKAATPKSLIQSQILQKPSYSRKPQKQKKQTKNMKDKSFMGYKPSVGVGENSSTNYTSKLFPSISMSESINSGRKKKLGFLSARTEENKKRPFSQIIKERSHVPSSSRKNYSATYGVKKHNFSKRAKSNNRLKTNFNLAKKGKPHKKGQRTLSEIVSNLSGDRECKSSSTQKQEEKLDECSNDHYSFFSKPRTISKTIGDKILTSKIIFIYFLPAYILRP